MSNCYQCVLRQAMGNMVGCKQRKQIIIDPDKEKDCCVLNAQEDFMAMFNRVVEDMARNPGK